jgi:L-amino acid N-acyltransferase YncA
MDPARHPLVLRRRSDGRVVGWAEVLDEHPRDGVPWIGLLQVHGQEQRRGLGREAAEALVGWAAARGATVLRVGVDEGNTAGAAFGQALGFSAVDERERVGPDGPVRVTVLERRLEP